MGINAINNYCILDIIRPPEEIKLGAIVLPNTVQVTPRWGRVSSTGEGVPDAYGNFRKPDVEVGDTVYAMAHGIFNLPKNINSEDSGLAATSVLDLLVVLKDMETLEIQPLGAYIEIEKVDPPKEEGTIELPDSRKAPTNLGRVISVGKGWVGPDGTPIPMQVKVGDLVVYNPVRTMVVDFSSLGKDNKKFIVQHGDILGVVQE